MMNDFSRERLRAMGQRWLTILIILLLPLAAALHPVPSSLIEGFEKANTALRKGDNNTAVSALQQVLQWSTNQPELQLLAAGLALDTGQNELALELLNNPVPLDPSATECIRIKASLAMADYQSAIMLLENAATGCPPPLDTIQKHADQAFKEGNIKDALRLLNQLMKYQPDNLALLKQIGLISTLSDPSTALELLLQYQAESGSEEQLTLDLIGTIERVLAVEQPAFTFAQIGQVFLRHQLWQEANLAFQQAIELDPEYFEARAYYGLTLEQLGQSEAGLLELQRAQKQAPSAPLPAYLLSRYWLIAQAPDQAIQFAQIARRADPADPTFAAQLAAGYSARGDLPAAEEMYQEAVKLSGGQAEFWQLLADFYIQHEIDPSSAVAAARQAYQMNPAAENADSLGYTHYLMGEMQLAQRFFKEAILLQPGLPSAHFHYGVTLAELGQPQQAIEQWQLTVELDDEGYYGSLASRALTRLE